MMDNFFGFKKSPYMFFHNKAVFHNIALPVGLRVMRGKNSPISTTASVGDSILKTWMENTSPLLHVGRIASLGAELFPVLKGQESLKRLAASDAVFLYGTIAPSSFLVASARAIFSFMNFVQIGGKRFFALLANCLHRIPLFVFIVSYLEEKYCEIAVKRLAQEVLF